MAHLPVFVEAAHGQIFRLETSEGRVQIRCRAKAANPSGGLQHLVYLCLSYTAAITGHPIGFPDIIYFAIEPAVCNCQVRRSQVYSPGCTMC